VTDDSTQAGPAANPPETSRTGSKSQLSRLERAGILTGIITGVTAVIISVASIMQTQDAQRRTDEQEQAAQANLVVTEFYPSNTKGTAVPWETGTEVAGQVMVQNFSDLPIYQLWIITNVSDLVGTLPPCSEINITRVAQVLGKQVTWGDGVPSVGLEYTDAAGLTWYRLGAEAPHKGQMPLDLMTKLARGSTVGGGETDMEPATPMHSCSGA
jgi:hypothetical protein